MKKVSGGSGLRQVEGSLAILSKLNEAVRARVRSGSFYLLAKLALKIMKSQSQHRPFPGAHDLFQFVPDFGYPESERAYSIWSHRRFWRGVGATIFSSAA